VAVTAFRGEEHQRQAREAGFDKYLMKPVDIDTLRQILAKAQSRTPGGPGPGTELHPT
jgi:CheY-like chemotaxis protein